jgi:hypothetical protein
MSSVGMDDIGIEPEIRVKNRNHTLQHRLWSSPESPPARAIWASLMISSETEVIGDCW